jgi:predicted ATPase with chaperone activity
MTWLLDRIRVEVPPVPFRELSDTGGGTTSGQMRDQVIAARDRQIHRFQGETSKANGKLGCALRQWLVINGEQRGFVWDDYRADEAGIEPLRDSATGNQMTFADWYMSWLDEAR